MSVENASKNLSFEQFVRLVLDAVEATGLEYLIGGAVAVWAYAEPRTTRDFDVVVKLPGSHIRRLSEELTKRDMLVPPEVILELLLQPEGDLPISAIHLYSSGAFHQQHGGAIWTSNLEMRNSQVSGNYTGDGSVDAEGHPVGGNCGGVRIWV